MAGKAASGPHPNLSEHASEWTNLVQTRISKKAKAELERQMAKAMAPSQAHFVRMLLYKALGLVKDEQP